MPNKLQIRQLDGNDADQFRKIRLEALQKHPEYFMSSYNEEKNEDVASFEDRLENQTFFGCFKGDEMLGIIGFTILAAEKMSHTSHIGAFYVKSEYRGRGFAKKLFSAAIDAASEVSEKIRLVVNAKNKSAIRIYKSLGFEKYGHDKKSLKIGDRYIDEILMVKFFD